jgi:hypothetical protein
VCFATIEAIRAARDRFQTRKANWNIKDKELNLRAGLAAFSDADRVVAVNLDNFAPLNSIDDLVRLLIQTGISFSRPSNAEIAAEDGDNSSRPRSAVATNWRPQHAWRRSLLHVGLVTAT